MVNAPKSSGSSPNEPSRAKQLFVRFFNYRAWIDWNRSKSIYNYFSKNLKKILITQKANKSQIKTFEEVVSEMKLTEDDLKVKEKSLRRLCYLMIIVGFLFYGYSMYHMLYGTALSVSVSFVLMLVCFTLAFRYHFWYFQIKSRKLGCSIKEWFKESFMGGDQ